MLSTPMIFWTTWNLFLAAVPVPLGLALVAAVRKNRQSPTIAGWFVAASVGCAWLAFLPNSCYLLTEWRHFLFNRHFQEARNLDNPAEFSVYRVARHAAFYAAYSGFGMLCFAASVRHAAVGMKHLGPWRRIVAVPFFLLVSLGVYLGLVVRFNSWDLIARPGDVLMVASRAMLSPRLVGCVAGFAVVLAAFCLAFDIWMDGLAVRLRSTGRERFPLDPESA